MFVSVFLITSRYSFLIRSAQQILKLDQYSRKQNGCHWMVQNNNTQGINKFLLYTSKLNIRRVRKLTFNMRCTKVVTSSFAVFGNL